MELAEDTHVLNSIKKNITNFSYFFYYTPNHC